MPLRWRRPRSSEDFEEEVRAHLDHETDRLIAEGRSPDEARRVAHRSFGGVLAATERFHDARTWCGIPLAGCEAAWLDVRYGVRMARRAPGLCVAVALTLSLGIGVGASLMTVFSGLFLRPNVSHDPSTYAKLFVSTTGGDVRSASGEPWAATPEEYEAIHQGSRTLAEVTASSWATFRVAGASSGQLRGQWVSCNYLLAHAPALMAGRSLTPADCDAGSAPVAVLSARAWTRVFGGAPDIVGRHVRLNGRVVEVVGVTRDVAVRDPVAAEVFLPILHRPDAAGLSDPIRRGHDAWISLSGRLRPGATLAQAQREIVGLVEAVNRPRGRASTARVTNGAAIFDPSAAKYVPMMVSAGAAALLLVAFLTSANTAMLLLARAVAREGEWAMRLRLGASPARVVRQGLIEGAVVALPAWAIGLGVAWWLPARVLDRLSVFPLSVDLTPDWRVWAGTGALTVATGLVTAMAAARHAVTAPIGSGSGTTTPRSHGWLLAPQVAACVVLAAGVATLTNADERWRAPRVPYDPRDVVVATLADGDHQSSSFSEASALAEVLRGVPGVSQTALASPVPFAGDVRTVVRGSHADAVATSVRTVSADFFALAQVDLVRGRWWGGGEHSSGAGVAVEVLASERLAERLGGFDPPARVELHDGRVLTVVGVVADTVSVRPDATDGPLLYVPAGTTPVPELGVLVRGGLTTSDQLRSLRPLNGAAPSFESLAAILSRSGAGYRTGRDLLGAVAGLALAIAGVGSGGAVAFHLRRRRRETAVRIALGATPVGLVAHNLRRTLAPAMTGGLVGIALSWVMGFIVWPAHMHVDTAYQNVIRPGLVVAVLVALAAAGAAALVVRATSLTALREE